MLPLTIRESHPTIMTTPTQELVADLNSYAKRIVEAFVPDEPLRPNDHLSSFFGFLKAPRLGPNTRRLVSSLSVSFSRQAKAWYAFISMRRRKSRPNGKAAYRSLHSNIESLSLDEQKELACRVANNLSDQLREVADRAWKARGLKRAKCPLSTILPLLPQC
jgi:hypothetical protein